MRILVIGQSGQLARALTEQAEASGIDFETLGRPELNLCEPDPARRTLEARLTGNNRPDLLINTAAYTAVDAAEDNEAAAIQLNSHAVALLAETCAAANCPIIHVSTDYVFSGSPGRPWQVDHPTDPISVYGASKRAGELVLARIWQQHIIVRTAWLFSEHAPNFMTTMIERARCQSEIRVVNDQIGSPTPAADLARVLLGMAKQILEGARPWGCYHYAGDTPMSRAEFAEAILQEAGIADCQVLPISSSEFPAKADRPAWSVLDSRRTTEVFGFPAADLKAGLASAVQRHMRLT